MSSSNIRCDGYVSTQTPDGAEVTTALTMAIRLTETTTVELPLPFVSIGNESAIGGWRLVIVPGLDIDSRGRLCFDFSLWSPAVVGPHGSAVHPAQFHSQDEAAEACRAFDANPDTAWSDSFGSKMAWSMAWTIQRGLRAEGDPR